MKLSLKTKKGKLIVFCAAGSLVVAGVAIAVPVVLTTGSSSSSDKPETLSTDAQLADFQQKYKGTIELNPDGKTGKVKPFAFQKQVIPSDFVLPPTIIAIGPGAFSEATIPDGFKIPETTTADSSSFLDASFSENYYWSFSDTRPGSTVVPVEKNDEYIAFVASRPKSLNGTTLTSDFRTNGTPKTTDYNLPSFLTTIGDRAMYGLTVPAGFKLPRNVKKIGNEAFWNSDLTNGITFPDGLSSIGYSAFSGTKLPADFSLPPSVTHLGIDDALSDTWSVFANVSFSNQFIIPTTLIYASSYAFSNVSVPTGFAIPSTLNLYRSVQGAFDPQTSRYSYTIEKVDEFANSSSAYQGNSFNIPKYNLWNSGKPSTGAKVVLNSSLPQWNAEIQLFLSNYPRSLAKVTSQDNDYEIVENAFKDIDLPADFKIPTLVSAIRTNAFLNAKINDSLVVPATLFNSAAFTAARFSENKYWSSSPYTYSDAVVSVVDVEETPTYKSFMLKYPNSLQGTKLVGTNFAGVSQENRKILDEKIVLPDFLTEIGDGVFKYTFINQLISLPAGLRKIGAETFLGSIFAKETPGTWTINGTIPGNVNTLLPSYVSQIGQDAFAKTRLPNSFTIPAALQYLGMDASLRKSWPVFTDATFGDDFFLPATLVGANEEFAPNALAGRNYKTSWNIIFYKSGQGGALSVDASGYSNSLSIPSGYGWVSYTNLWHRVTVDREAMQSELDDFMVAYPGTVDNTYTNDPKIKENAFKGRKNLPESFKLPELITGIKAGAFEDATLPKSFSIPRNPSQPYPIVDPTAFKNALYDEGVFWSMDTLSNGARQAGDTLISIYDNEAFIRFNFKFPGKLLKKAFVDSAFERAALGTDFRLPSFVTSIGKKAFYNASFANSGYYFFPSSANVDFIGEEAFGPSLPYYFDLPSSLTSFGIDEQRTKTWPIFASGTVLPTGFQLPESLQYIGENALFGTTVPIGFKISASASIYELNHWGLLSSDSYSSSLKGITLPSGAKWSTGSQGAIRGAEVVAN